MKIKIKVLIEAEYETDTDWYEPDTSIDEMADIDLHNDSGMFLTDAELKIVSVEQI